ncbi:hypothetical protein HHK36_001375 [Tetracentron sinense]|uniref:NAC domain-containing protein n=1 Tax=Tetracentron sinense TaxID=13715 RepID=A0A834ZTA6_TETSI|nr:hypothetical protein HHK36_001375 [Tetracentron sinense]
MAEDMSLSVNGQSRVPPGFRFHPTEEELLHYYLRKKVAYEEIDLDVICDVDLNKLEPWDIQEKCKIGSTPQNDWYFFSHKDKKYPTGTRTNRATAAGFWKATGRDKVIYSSFRRIGMRKTLVFYRGRAPHGQKSDWIMHEYRLDDNITDPNASNSTGETSQEDGWVICRVFKKRNSHKALDGPNNSSVTNDMRSQMLNSSNDRTLCQILQYMGRTFKQENDSNMNVTTTKNNMSFFKPIDTAIGNGIHERFMQLPRLESPTLPSLPRSNTTQFDEAYRSQVCYLPNDVQMLKATEASVTNQSSADMDMVHQTEPGLNGWAALDRFMASHLNGQEDTSKQLTCFNDPNMAFCSSPDHDIQHFPPNRSDHTTHDYNNEIDLWSFIGSSSSSSDPLCNVSNASV